MVAIHFLSTIALFGHLVAYSGCERASGATQSDLLITPNSLTAARCWGVQLCAGVLVNKKSFIFFPSRVPRSCLDRHRLTFVSISGYSNRRETRDVRESLCYIRCTFYVVGTTLRGYGCRSVSVVPAFVPAGPAVTFLFLLALPASCQS